MNWMGTGIRAAISVTLLAFLLANVDIGQVLVPLSTASVPWLALALASALAAWVINTAKWSVLLAALERRLSYFYLLALNFVGMFYSMVLPGQIGGEVVKGIRLARYGVAPSDAALSIAADRLTGLIGLALLGVAGVLLAETVPASQAMLILASGVVATAGALLLLGRLRSPSPARANEAGEPTVQGRIRSGMEAAWTTWAAYARSPALLGMVILQAVTFQALVTLSNYLVARSVGVEISIVALAWIVSAVSLVHLLPISLAGLGVREGAYVMLLQQYGVPPAEGLALSLAVFLVILAQALLGGALELFWSGLEPQLLRTLMDSDGRRTPGPVPVPDPSEPPNDMVREPRALPPQTG